ncbi:hypothetical protein GQ602_007048 [Ophiocordyceps camponoti-floridani]|uniref:Uncharacterized protein n=1 Tax=Ophiocordyceps camponoti-floridani TaxID=2030778 RepID=A0A8H4Q0N2_9HYPO|nr:hypothetical protein GQ602_007048 [Ophiocordyceps camponoti-floridani]
MNTLKTRLSAILSLITLYLLVLLHHNPHLTPNLASPHPKTIPLNTTNLALLIEPRPSPPRPQTAHMLSIIPPHGRCSSSAPLEPPSPLPLTRPTTPPHKRTPHLATPPKKHPIDTPEDQARLLTSLSFYRHVLPPANHLFRFTANSILCANSPESLDDHLSWSWAGAHGLTMSHIPSLESVLAFQSRRNDSEPEDVWFRKRLAAMPGHAVAEGEAWPFAVGRSLESVGKKPPLGYYVSDVELWTEPELRRGALDYCPELAIILDMKLERERCPDDDGHGRRIS